MPKPKPNLLDVLYRALGTKFGIVVTTNNVERLRAKLYATRKASGDEDLQQLILKPSPIEPETKLFIVRKNAQGTSGEENP